MSEQDEKSRDNAQGAIPDRIWDLYFGPAGQIPQLHDTIGKLHKKLNETNRRIDKYNNLHGLMETLAGQVTELCATTSRHETVLRDQSVRQETEIEVLEREASIAEKARDKEAERYNRIIKTASVSVGLLTFAYMIASHYLG